MFFFFVVFVCFFTENTCKIDIFKPKNEPRHEKNGFLHMRKQRRRSALR